ncbi:hypothetical protein TYRP_016104 [Tyrophagus putrescentiae]|nr:hypothetical protein TYRP_016104 [Tyrophagus putrescentiae]
MVGMRATITKLKNMPHLKDVQDNGARVCVCSSSKHQGPGNIIVRDALVHVWETFSRQHRLSPLYLHRHLHSRRAQRTVKSIPKDIDIQEVQEKICNIRDVCQEHILRIW